MQPPHFPHSRCTLQRRCKQHIMWMQRLSVSTVGLFMQCWICSRKLRQVAFNRSAARSEIERLNEVKLPERLAVQVSGCVLQGAVPRLEREPSSQNGKREKGPTGREADRQHGRCLRSPPFSGGHEAVHMRALSAKTKHQRQVVVAVRVPQNVER